MEHAKPSFELVGVRHVVELPEPIDDLAETVLETRGPFQGGFLALAAEDARRCAFFQLHEPISLAMGVAHHEIACEIPEQLVFVSEQIVLNEVFRIGTKEGRKLPVRGEKRLDVPVLFQVRFGGEQIAQGQHFLQTQVMVERDGQKVFHGVPGTGFLTR
jgi:hypothetical protein